MAARFATAGTRTPCTEDADCVAPNASMHGREEVLGFLGVFWDAFPDGRLETSRLLGEGSVVAVEAGS